MKNLGKKEKIILAVAVLILIVSIGFFVTKTLINNSKPSVYYKVYTKEDGWSKWCKDGELCGNKHDITALQIKIKNSFNKNISFVTYKDKNYKGIKYVNNNQVSGNKKDAIKVIRIKNDKNIEKKYNIKYKTFTSNKYETIWSINNEKSRGNLNTDSTIDPIRYIQIVFEKKVK